MRGKKSKPTASSGPRGSLAATLVSTEVSATAKVDGEGSGLTRKPAAWAPLGCREGEGCELPQREGSRQHGPRGHRQVGEQGGGAGKTQSGPGQRGVDAQQQLQLPE